MKQKIYLLVLFIFLLIIFIYYPKSKSQTVNFKIENKTYKLLIADSIGEWTKGLMNIKELKGADGMIFIFKDKQFRTFWNKNTYLNLEVYWILNEKVIGKSYLPSINESKGVIYVNSPAPVDKVVELVIK
jgi:uncharacterized membrane protein (UPF0127 family)